ncbi:hypothetical protein BC940DRAFT_371739 [Gongronella butleri]|nr:hypothetical protein BC940DRAFT_371739 [Gongronella butleri]
MLVAWSTSNCIVKRESCLSHHGLASLSLFSTFSGLALLSALSILSIACIAMNSLPNELLKRVLEEVKRSDLRNLRLTCRLVRDLVTPLLFEHVAIYWYEPGHFNDLISPDVGLGPFFRSLRIVNAVPPEKAALKMSKRCPNLETLILEGLVCSEVDICAFLKCFPGIKHLTLIRISIKPLTLDRITSLDIHCLIQDVLPRFVSLKSLHIRPVSCLWKDLVKIQRICPDLTSLEYGTRLDDQSFLMQFLQSDHRPGHDSDCDACTNPWLSITSLSFEISSIADRFSTLPAFIALLCLKFPNLTRLSINSSVEDNYIPYDDLDEIDFAISSSWRSLLDPSIAHWPLLTSFRLEHPYAELVMEAVHEFTSVIGMSASFLTTLLIEAVKSFGNKYTMGLLAAFPHLHTLVVNDESSDERDDVPEDLVLQDLPMPTLIHHPLRELSLTYVNSAVLLKISKLCSQLTRVTLTANHWDLEKDDLAPYPEDAMPDIVDQLAIVQKFKQTPNWSKDHKFWVPLPFSANLTSLKVRIWEPSGNTVYFVQTPACTAQSRDAISIAAGDETLGFTGSYLNGRRNNEMHVVADPQAALGTNWAQSEEAAQTLHKKYATVILSPCAPDILELQIFRKRWIWDIPFD